MQKMPQQAITCILSGCASVHIMWCIVMFSDARCKQFEKQVEHMKQVKTDLEGERNTERQIAIF